MQEVSPNWSSDAHRIHLAAFGAPTLDIPIQFADIAAALFCAYREKYYFGASEMRPECGNIYDSQNHLVGKISYNGRIWDAQERPVE